MRLTEEPDVPHERKEDVLKQATGWIAGGTCGGGERAETGQSRVAGVPFYRATAIAAGTDIAQF